MDGNVLTVGNMVDGGGTGSGYGHIIARLDVFEGSTGVAVEVVV